MTLGDFPGDPVVKTLSFQCHAGSVGLIPGRELTSHTCKKKKKCDLGFVTEHWFFFSLGNMNIITDAISQVRWEDYEIMHAKTLSQCMACSRHSINNSWSFLIRYTGWLSKPNV